MQIDASQLRPIDALRQNRRHPRRVAVAVDPEEEPNLQPRRYGRPDGRKDLSCTQIRRFERAGRNTHLHVAHGLGQVPPEQAPCREMVALDGRKPRRLLLKQVTEKVIEPVELEVRVPRGQVDLRLHLAEQLDR